MSGRSGLNHFVGWGGDRGLGHWSYLPLGSITSRLSRERRKSSLNFLVQDVRSGHFALHLEFLVTVVVRQHVVLGYIPHNT